MNGESSEQEDASRNKRRKLNRSRTKEAHRASLPNQPEHGYSAIGKKDDRIEELQLHVADLHDWVKRAAGHTREHAIARPVVEDGLHDKGSIQSNASVDADLSDALKAVLHDIFRLGGMSAPNALDLAVQAMVKFANAYTAVKPINAPTP